MRPRRGRRRTADGGAGAGASATLAAGAAHAGLLGVRARQLGLRAGRLRHRAVQRIDPGRARLRPRTIYYRTLAVTALTALVGNFAAGAWADAARCAACSWRRMLLLTGSLAALPHVSTQAHVMAHAVVMGLAGGFVMVVFFSFWGRAYGRTHLGRIQGAAQILTVLASARRTAAPGPVRGRGPARTRRRSTRWPRWWPCSAWPRSWCRCRRRRGTAAR